MKVSSLMGLSRDMESMWGVEGIITKGSGKTSSRMERVRSSQ